MMRSRPLKGRAITIAAIAITLFTTPIMASDATGRPMRFNHLTLDEGLSQSNVLSVLQDSDGMMWFGTENGLNKYNGYEFEHFKRERGNPEALSSDFIFDVEEAGNGRLWIATNGGGLAEFNRTTGRVTTYRHDLQDSNSIASDILRTVLIDNDGIVWVGTVDAGLDRFDPKSKQVTHFDLSSADAKTGTIFALYQDTRDELWIGGDHGLTRLNTRNNETTTFTHDSGNNSTIDHYSVRAIEKDSDGRLWVGTYGGGLSRLTENGLSFEHFVHVDGDATTIAGNEISSIFLDSDDRLWVGTDQGLNLVNHKTGAADQYSPDATDASSLSDKNITAIYQDRSGLLWIGTQYQGLSTWNPRTWQFGLEPARELTTSGKAEPNVMALLDDGAGTLWVGTFGEGLNAIDRSSGEITKYRNDASSDLTIGDNYVMSLMRDSKGRIWAGTMSAGITRLDLSAGTSDSFVYDASDPNSLSANGVMTMHEDRNGQVWVGTFGGGISVYDPQSDQFSRHAADASNPFALSDSRVTAFAEDAQGNMWIGTDAGGLNLYNAKTGNFHHFRHHPEDPRTIASDKIYSLNIDAEGTVWVGTHGGGLDRVVGDANDPGAIYFANVSQKDGLTNDVIYSVYSDAAGWVWLSTNYGINRYNPATGEFKHLHRKDGLQSEEFNFGAHFQSSTGELIFGGHNGYNAFHPEDIEASKVIPLIALTGFFSGGNGTKTDVPVDENGDIEISWKDDVIAFEFAALDYVAPSQNQYMYKLEGFDEDWIDLGNRRTATYTDLNDGNYLLRVRAASSDGVWNEAGFALPIHVTAAPWDTWWAYLGYTALVILLAIGVWLGHRRKLQREEEYSHRLEQEVQIRTLRLRDKNEELKVLNGALQESSLSDPLTGLRNRRFVFEEVSRDLEVIKRRLANEREGDGQKVAAEMIFMMIDLDHFKPINDTYGHAAGDKMLLELRDLLLSVCQSTDFVIRWGGDEFVVISKQTKPLEAESLAERIRSIVANTKFILNDGQIVRTTCSIGFAAYPLFKTRTDDSSLDQIINLADGLMYEAKKQRNAWVGMLSPSDVATSCEYDTNLIDSSSMLFRARRAGNLKTYRADDTIEDAVTQAIPLRANAAR
jgi:diguanylate cyclase (GGDEF)-like protein